MEIIVTGDEQMQALGMALAKAWLSLSAKDELSNRPWAIYLHGDLGTGKTTLVRGFLRACGYKGKVKSPTFTLVEPYQVNQSHIYHFDLYRLADPEELEYMGIRDYFSAPGVLLIEWPEQGQPLLPEADIHVLLYYHERGRRVEITTTSENAKSLLSQIKKNPN